MFRLHASFFAVAFLCSLLGACAARGTGYGGGGSLFGAVASAAAPTPTSSAPTGEPVDLALWGVYGKVAGRQWRAQVGGMDIVSTYSWITPGLQLEQRDRLTGMGVDMTTVSLHTYDATTRSIRSSLNMNGASSSWSSIVNPDGSLSGSASNGGVTAHHVIRMPNEGYLQVASRVPDAGIDSTVYYRDVAYTGPVLAAAQPVAPPPVAKTVAPRLAPTPAPAPVETDSGFGFFDAIDVMSDVAGVAGATGLMDAEAAAVLDDVGEIADTVEALGTGDPEAFARLAGYDNPLAQYNGRSNPLAGLSGNANPLTGAAPSTSARSGKGAVAPGSYPARPNTLAGHPACAGYTVENYQQYFDAHSNGPDVQLHTLCAGAFNYYWMYLNAIRQGYTQADSDITYRAFQDAARVATNFYATAR